MTDEVEFGDWEPEDSVVADNVPDPYQVAVRIHELRMWLDAESGETPKQWADLDDDEVAVAVALGEVLIRHLAEGGEEGAALALHEARRFLSEQPEWKDLDVEAQAVAIGLADDIVRWLRIEGTEIS